MLSVSHWELEDRGSEGQVVCTSHWELEDRGSEGQVAAGSMERCSKMDGKVLLSALMHIARYHFCRSCTPHPPLRPLAANGMRDRAKPASLSASSCPLPSLKRPRLQEALVLSWPN